MEEVLCFKREGGEKGHRGGVAAHGLVAAVLVGGGQGTELVDALDRGALLLAYLGGGLRCVGHAPHPAKHVRGGIAVAR